VQLSTLNKSLVTFAVLALIGGAIWRFYDAKDSNRKVQTTISAPKISRSKHRFSNSESFAPKTARPPSESVIFGAPQKISHDQAEEWLARHGRDATSLLAAFRAMNDTNYLNEAMAAFPNDPRVELAVLSRHQFSAERRKWLDLLKKSSPNNSLANYLSAQHYFENGQTAEAVQELLSANGKSQFDNFETESRLDAEAMYLSSGKSAIESAGASLADISDEATTEMANLKSLANSVRDLEKQYLDSNDADSAANLAQLGMTLANQLSSGDSGKYILNQLVGIADADVVLSKLDRNAAYDFLGGQTPDQVMRKLKEQRDMIHQSQRSFDTAYLKLTPDEINRYVERTKIFGELDAMKWVIQQHPQADSAK
jgi:hypothetical protein